MRILILAALEKEISVLNNLIDAESIDDFCYAKVNNNEIYIATTGVGILNAFSTTHSMIEKLYPDVVINIGTAGGHTLEVEDGDIVICDEAIYHGGYVMSNTPTASWEVMDSTKLIVKGDKKLSKLLDDINVDMTIYHGATLSGDFFTRDIEMIKSLHSKYHHLCEDMETIAIYKACKEKMIPAIAFRIISNNELRGTLYKENVLEVNEKLQRVIARLLHSI